MTTDEQEITARFALAKQVAREAGQLTLQYFQSDRFDVERKGDDSPVTIADREAEQLLRKRIQAAFPDDAILGEEFGETQGHSGARWILDPIDGTKSFISGVPLYGTMVGMEWQGEPTLGAVYIPGLDEGVYAARQQGAWHVRGDQSPVPARVSSKQLENGLFVTSQVDSFQQRTPDGLPAYQELEQAAYITRTWGDCYGYLLVATGRAEVMIDPEMNVWDAAAVAPILLEAGGTFTDWKGAPTIHSREGVGTNGVVLEQVLEITRRYS